MRLARLVAYALAAGPLVVLAAGLTRPAPAAADPARPTNDRSRVVALVPPTSGIRLDVVGGDAFLRLRVDAGRSVAVPGYEGEPYLRVDPDGTVEENQRSPARWLNSSRYGPTTPPPPRADARAAPEWRSVGESGRYVWHDHRIHSMGGPAPPQWEIPLEVDGVAVVAQGTLTRLPAPSAWPWALLAAATGIATIALLAASGAFRSVGLGLVIAAAGAAVVVGVAEARALPGAAGGGPLVVALPAVALAAAATAAGLARARPLVAAPFLAGAGVALVVWAARRRAVVDHAVLLTGLPEALDRAAVAVGFGVGLAAAVAGTAAVLFPRRTVA